MIITNDKGDVVNRVEGFRDARGFVRELQKAMAAIDVQHNKG